MSRNLNRIHSLIFGWLPRKGAGSHTFREQRKLRDRDLRDIGIKTHDVAAMVDREIGRLGLDEFRSRG